MIRHSPRCHTAWCAPVEHTLQHTLPRRADRLADVLKDVCAMANGEGGNVFIGCRAWNNADDGWDFYQNNESVLISNCWSFANGSNLWNYAGTWRGNGNGFKLGGAGMGRIDCLEQRADHLVEFGCSLPCRVGPLRQRLGKGFQRAPGPGLQRLD